MREKGGRLTDGAYKDVKGPALDVGGAPEIDEFDAALAVQDDVLVLDVAVHDLGFGV